MLKLFPYNKIYLFLGLGYLLLILIVSLMPLNNLPLPGFNGIDKVEHFFAYLLAAGYFVQLVKPRGFMWLGFFLIGYGVSIELLQSLTTYRLFELWDIVANSIGVVSGVLLGRRHHQLLEKCHI